MSYLLAGIACALVIAGIAVIYWPVGLICAGLLLGLAAWYIDFAPEDRT